MKVTWLPLFLICSLSEVPQGPSLTSLPCLQAPIRCLSRKRSTRVRRRLLFLLKFIEAKERKDQIRLLLLFLVARWFGVARLLSQQRGCLQLEFLSELLVSSLLLAFQFFQGFFKVIEDADEHLVSYHLSSSRLLLQGQSFPSFLCWQFAFSFLLNLTSLGSSSISWH